MALLISDDRNSDERMRSTCFRTLFGRPSSAGSCVASATGSLWAFDFRFIPSIDRIIHMQDGCVGVEF